MFHPNISQFVPISSVVLRRDEEQRDWVDGGLVEAEWLFSVRLMLYL